MHIHALRIKNFRRLRDVQIDLNSDISIFVGANNSGKTSRGRHRIRNINPVKVFSVTSRRLLAKIHLGQYVDKAFGV